MLKTIDPKKLWIPVFCMDNRLIKVSWGLELGADLIGAASTVNSSYYNILMVNILCSQQGIIYLVA